MRNIFVLLLLFVPSTAFSAFIPLPIGNTTTANSVPVTMASDQPTQKVTLQTGGATQPVNIIGTPNVSITNNPTVTVQNLNTLATSSNQVTGSQKTQLVSSTGAEIGNAIKVDLDIIHNSFQNDGSVGGPNQGSLISGWDDVLGGLRTFGVNASRQMAIQNPPNFDVLLSTRPSLVNQVTELASLASILANQTNATQKSQQVDGSGNVMPAGDVNPRGVFVRPGDGTNTQGYTAGNEAKVSVTTILPTSDVVANGNLTSLVSVVSIPVNGLGGGAVNISGTFVGNIQVQGIPNGGTPVNLSTLQAGAWSTGPLTGPGFFKFRGVAGFQSLQVIFTSYTSGTAAVTIEGTAVEGNPIVVQSNPDNLKSRAIAPTATQTDTYTTTANGVTVNVVANPLKTFSMQVDTTGVVTTWDVRLECSLTGSASSFTQVLQHTNTQGSGTMVASGAALFPCLFFRSRVAGLLLGGGTNLIVTILGVQ